MLTDLHRQGPQLRGLLAAGYTLHEQALLLGAVLPDGECVTSVALAEFYRAADMAFRPAPHQAPLGDVAPDWVRAMVAAEPLDRLWFGGRAIDRALFHARRVALDYGLLPSMIYGPARMGRQTRAAAARAELMVRLYDPETRGNRNPGARLWGISRIGRLMRMHHASVLHHLRKSGMEVQHVGA